MKSRQQYFHAHETKRQAALEGLPLASFSQRALGYALDILLVAVFYVPVEVAWRRLVMHEQDIHVDVNFHNLGSLVALVLYFALSVFLFRGKTFGKWVARTRVVSLTHARPGLWQSTERALGYGASALEVGFGFLQFFFSRNRMCVHDRIAETIVVDTRAKSQLDHGAEETDPELGGAG